MADEPIHLSRWTMDYIAHVFVGSSNANAVEVKSFDSLGVDNAYDAARIFALEQVETCNFARIYFEVNKSETVVKDLWVGAFTHPLRGRVKFVCNEDEFKTFEEQTRKKADAPIYSPNQLYAMTPVTVAHTDILSYLINGWFEEWFEGFNTCDKDWRDIESLIEDEKRIEIRYLADIYLDLDESWVLATLWFDGMPIAVLTHQGEDTYTAHITYRKAVNEMVDWIRSSMPSYFNPDPDPDKPQEVFTEFWGRSLHDFYDVSSGLPKRSPNRSWRHWRHN